MDTYGLHEQPVYLDGHATTPLAPEALAAMAPWWSDRAANAHSPHRRGLDAARAVEDARDSLSRLIGCGSQEITFTSGATEANNLAIVGVAEAARQADDARRDIIVSAIEHKSVLDAADALKARGYKVVRVPVTVDGIVDPSILRATISPNTLLVSVMAANNEIGTVQPIGEVASLVRAAGAMLHVDAAQMVGKLPFDASITDFASISSHKMYGPMGVGALFVSAAAEYRPRPLIYGGSQERGLRPGTLPTPLIVGFGSAAEVACASLAGDATHSRALSAHLLTALERRQVRYVAHIAPQSRLPGSLSLRLVGVDAASLIDSLGDTVCLSEGSACASGQTVQSHVLRAVGLTNAHISETVRLYCSRYNTIAEVEFAAERIARAVESSLRVARWTDRPVGFANEGHLR